jgi:tetratricopeptide (TPR) repeat protein
VGISLWKSIVFFLIILGLGFFLMPSQRQLGMVYSQTRKFAAAMPYLERQYQKNPDDLFNTRRYLEGLLEQGNFKKFEDIAQKLVVRYPHEPLVLTVLADFYEGQLMYPEASQYWEAMLAKNPKLIDVREKLVIYYINVKQNDALIRLYESEAPEQKDPDMFYSLALLYAARQDIPAIERIYQQVLKRFPKEEVAKRKLVDLYETTGQQAQALNLLQRLYEENPFSREYAQRLVEKFLVENRNPEAVQVLNVLAQRFANQDKVLLTIAEYLLRAGDRKQASKLMDMLALRPVKSLNRWDKLAELYFSLENYPRAQEFLRRFHEQGRGNYHSHHVLGDVLAALGTVRPCRLSAVKKKS